MTENNNEEFEQRKQLQLKLHELIDKCNEKKIPHTEKLLEFVERATLVKKDYKVWIDIVKEILDTM